MLCDKCKKNEAKVYYTEIVNSEKTEQHLCEDCAMEYTTFQAGNSFVNHDFTLGNLLSTILGNYYIADNNETKQVKKDISCKGCGMTQRDFMRLGRFGCNKCYETFEGILDKSIHSIQGSSSHIGKKPKNFITKTRKIVKDLSEIDKLTIRLQDAIEKEEFEEAAKIRDRIRILKKEEMNNA